jgi:hypothetical protein
VIIVFSGGVRVSLEARMDRSVQSVTSDHEYTPRFLPSQTGPDKSAAPAKQHMFTFVDSQQRLILLL